MADYQYRFLGDSPKIFTTRRSDEKLVQPGDLVESDVPLHHGHLEPLSAPAMDFAEENELAMAHEGGELWLRPEKKAAKQAADQAEADRVTAEEKAEADRLVAEEKRVAREVAKATKEAAKGASDSNPNPTPDASKEA